MYKNVKKYNKNVSRVLLASIVFMSIFHFAYLILRGKLQELSVHHETEKDYENYKDNMSVA